MARLIDAYQAIDIIDEWLGSVGTVMVGKGLSSYGELIGCIEDAPTLTQPNEWVSVEDRLPKINAGYIVCCNDEGCPHGEGIWYQKNVVVYADYYDGSWTWYEGSQEYDLEGIVTHWMPIPAPPDRRPPEGEE